MARAQLTKERLEPRVFLQTVRLCTSKYLWGMPAKASPNCTVSSAKNPYDHLIASTLMTWRVCPDAVRPQQDQNATVLMRFTLWRRNVHQRFLRCFFSSATGF